MKVWVGYGSENSANLVIIGKFESTQKADEALKLLEEATRIARADESAGRLTAGSMTSKFSHDMMDFFRRTNFASFAYGDPEQLLYDYRVAREPGKLVLTTEELEINAFMKLFIHFGAKVEVYSAHDHGGAYGRHTRP